MTTCGKSRLIVCCQALAVADDPAEEDSSARPYLSDSTPTAAEPSRNQALKQHVRLDIQAPDTKKLLVAAVRRFQKRAVG